MSLNSSSDGSGLSKEHDNLNLSGESNASSEEKSILTAQDVGHKFKLSKELVVLLEQVEYSEDDPILILDFKQYFTQLGGNKTTVIDALVQHGAKRIGVDENVVQFDNWSMVFAAREEMMKEMPYYFNHVKPHPDCPDSFKDSVNPQYTLWPFIPRITTTCLTTKQKTQACDCNFEQADYQFFELS